MSIPISFSCLHKVGKSLVLFTVQALLFFSSLSPTLNHVLLSRIFVDQKSRCCPISLLHILISCVNCYPSSRTKTPAMSVSTELFLGPPFSLKLALHDVSAPLSIFLPLFEAASAASARMTKLNVKGGLMVLEMPQLAVSWERRVPLEKTPPEPNIAHDVRCPSEMFSS